MLTLRKTAFFSALFIGISLAGGTSAHAASAVQRASLPDDREYYLMASHALPMAVVEITFQDAGAISDPKGLAGRATLAASLLKEGAGKFDSAAFHKALEDKAIELSVSTSGEDLSISVQALQENLPAALELTAQMLTQPHFDEADFTRLRGQLQSALKEASQNPSWLASTHFSALAFGDHPFALPAEGTEKSLAALQPSDLKQWHALLNPKKMLISAAGDISPDTLSPFISTVFSALKPTAAPTYPKAEITPEALAEKQPFTVAQDIPQSVVLLGLPAIDRNDPDFYAAYVLNYILGGGGLTSRLSNSLRQEHGLAYYASTALAAGRYSSVLYGNFATRKDSAAEALKLAQEVLSRFATQGATPEEVINAIDFITGSFPLSLDDLQSQAGYLTVMQSYHLGADYLEKRNALFRAVTTEDVNRVAAKLLAKTPLIVLIGGEK